MSHRTVSFLIRVVFVAGLTGLLAACTSTSSDSFARAEAEPGISHAAIEQSVADPTPTPDDLDRAIDAEFAPTLQFVETAAAYIDATPHRFEGFLLPGENAVDVPEGFGESPAEFGESDGTIVSSTIDVSMLSEDDEQLFRYTIVDGSLIYQYDPSRGALMSSFNDFGFSPDEGAMARSGEEWVVMDWSVLSPGVPIESTASASDLVKALQVADRIVEGPPSVVRGVETRTIEAAISGSSLVEADPENEVPVFSGPEVEMAVHVDAAGVIRRITTTLDKQVERRVEFFDVGSDISIELPDATDITGMLIAEREAFGANFGSGSDESVPVVPEETTPEAVPAPVVYSVIDLLAAQPELSVLLSLLEQQGDVRDLLASDDGSWTLFAPTNDSFAWFGDAELEAVRSDPDRLTALLERHLVQGSVDADAIGNMTTLESLGGDLLKVSTAGSDSVVVGGAYILVGDATAANGVVHIVADVVRAGP